MNTEKQVKNTSSRMFRQPEGISAQQFRLKDNRESKVDQKKLMQLIQCPTVSYIQRQTEVISQEGQQYNYGTGTVQTGSKIEVGLDPKDMPQGQRANLNIGQEEMMKSIRNKYHITGGELVRGHLWNDNLGGSAQNINLYPITGAANKDHLSYVENKAKKSIFSRIPIYYKVEVNGNPNINEKKAQFVCEIKEWNPDTKEIGEDLYPPVTIHSDLDDVSGYKKATNTGSESFAEKFKNPRKPKWLKNPKTKVSELTEEEVRNRLNDAKPQDSSNQDSSNQDSLNEEQNVANYIISSMFAEGVSSNFVIIQIDTLISTGLFGHNCVDVIRAAMQVAIDKVNKEDGVYGLLELANNLINTENFNTIMEISSNIVNVIRIAMQAAMQKAEYGDLSDLLELANNLINTEDFNTIMEKFSGIEIENVIGTAMQKAEYGDLSDLLKLANNLINTGNFNTIMEKFSGIGIGNVIGNFIGIATEAAKQKAEDGDLSYLLELANNLINTGNFNTIMGKFSGIGIENVIGNFIKIAMEAAIFRVDEEEDVSDLLELANNLISTRNFNAIMGKIPDIEDFIGTAMRAAIVRVDEEGGVYGLLELANNLINTENFNTIMGKFPDMEIKNVIETVYDDGDVSDLLELANNLISTRNFNAIMKKIPGIEVVIETAMRAAIDRVDEEGDVCNLLELANNLISTRNFNAIMKKIPGIEVVIETAMRAAIDRVYEEGGVYGLLELANNLISTRNFNAIMKKIPGIEVVIETAMRAAIDRVGAEGGVSNLLELANNLISTRNFNAIMKKIPGIEVVIGTAMQVAIDIANSGNKYYLLKLYKSLIDINNSVGIAHELLEHSEVILSAD